MGKFAFREMVSCVLLLLFPGSMLAADSNAAMLYVNGAACVNDAHVPRASSAIFSGDMLQTRPNSVANINEPGSSITVLSDSLVQFDGESVDIQHGGVTVSTSKGVAATAGDVKSDADVECVDGIQCHGCGWDGQDLCPQRRPYHQRRQGCGDSGARSGHDPRRTQSYCGKQQEEEKQEAQGGAVPAAGGRMTNSPFAVGIGAGAVVGVTTWVLVKSDNPASPTKP